MAKSVYLHVGSGKTGTSTIQDFLDKNSRHFKDSNIFVPGFLGPKMFHIWLFLLLVDADHPLIAMALPWVQECSFNLLEPNGFKSAVSNKLEELSSWIEYLPSESKILLSCEWLFDLPESSLMKVDQYFSNCDLSVLAWIREPSSFLLSTWRQHTINGFPEPLDSPVQMLSSNTNILDIKSSVQRMFNIFGDRLKIRKYCRLSMENGDIRNDYCKACGIDPSCVIERGSTDEDKNISIGWSAQKVIAHINLFYPMINSQGHFSRSKGFVTWLLDFGDRQFQYKYSREEFFHVLNWYKMTDEYLASEVFGVDPTSLWAKRQGYRGLDEDSLYQFALTKYELDVANVVLKAIFSG